MSSAVIPVGSDADLRSIIDRALASLAGARTFAEILEAKELALLAQDVAKRAARLAKATGAHDDLVARAHRLKADALEIEARAARRLADEYDAAQERGEIKGNGGARKFTVPNENSELPSAADIGVTRKTIFDGRRIRDAERDDPGVVRRSLDGMIERGEVPTRAALRREVAPPASAERFDDWFDQKTLSEDGRVPVAGIPVVAVDTDDGVSDVPTWRTKVENARAVGLASLTAEEDADRIAAHAANVARTREAKAAARSRAQYINCLAVEGGFKPQEIARQLSIATSTLRSIRKAWGLALAQRDGFRRLFVWISDANVEALDRMAADMGIERGRALAELLSVVLGDDGLAARRILKIQRRAA